MKREPKTSSHFQIIKMFLKKISLVIITLFLIFSKIVTSSQIVSNILLGISEFLPKSLHKNIFTTCNKKVHTLSYNMYFSIT